MLSIEPDVIQDLEVITGTFNAEYGNAMSGVANAVTKDGSNKLSGSFLQALVNMLLATQIFSWVLINLPLIEIKIINFNLVGQSSREVFFSLTFAIKIIAII